MYPEGNCGAEFGLHNKVMGFWKQIDCANYEVLTLCLQFCSTFSPCSLFLLLRVSDLYQQDKKENVRGDSL